MDTHAVQDALRIFALFVALLAPTMDTLADDTEDGGLSWQHVELAFGYQGPLIIVAGIETILRDGVPHYLLPAHRNNRHRDRHGYRRQFDLESTSLLRWNMADYVDYPESNPGFQHEGKIASSDEGEGLKIVVRTARMDRDRPLDPPRAFESRVNSQSRTTP